jgi:hypothetical protein
MPCKTFLARKSMAGAAICGADEVSLDEPKMRQRQTACRCQFLGISRLDKALRAQLTRCGAGEADDPSDPEELTLWVIHVSSGESYRATEVNAQADAVSGLTLRVRLSVCTNTGGGLACDE